MIGTAFVSLIVYFFDVIVFGLGVISIPANLAAYFMQSVEYFISYIMIFEPIFPVTYLLQLMAFNMLVLASVLAFRVLMFGIMLLRGGHYSPGEIK